MHAIVKCTALRAVRADRLYHPGETLDLGSADAAALEADGAVRRLHKRRPPKPAGDAKPARNPAPAPADITTIKGIGPKMAEQLAASGITSLADLAALSDQELRHEAAGLTVVGDPLVLLTGWRAAARAFVRPASDAEPASADIDAGDSAEAAPEAPASDAE